MHRWEYTSPPGQLTGTQEPAGQYSLSAQPESESHSEHWWKAAMRPPVHSSAWQNPPLQPSLLEQSESLWQSNGTQMRLRTAPSGQGTVTQL
jgi:hypothetical protein